MAITPAFEKGEVSLDDLQHHYDRARSIGLAIIEREARKVLKDDPTIKEFVMAMGSATFTCLYDGGEELLHVEDVDSSLDLKFILDEWDDVFKFTGEPMRFTATGPVRREW